MGKKAPASEASDHLAPTLVVGVGASAGGLEALTELLEGIAPDTDAAFILIQHLDPEHESGLAALLSRATDMPVLPAKEGVRVRGETVYVITPGTELTIVRDVLHVGPRSRARGPHPTIDPFLASLAADRGATAVGVVLSGTGSDGTEGLRAIRAEDGITFAQDPGSAAFGAMPEAAIEAGVADTVDTPAGIGRALSKAARYRPEKKTVASTDFDEALMPEVFAALEASSGIDFSGYKRPTIHRRLIRRMAVRSAPSLAAYLDILRGDADEVGVLSRDLLIMVTSFFREPEALELLKSSALPSIITEGDPGAPIRIWVAGCGTGQEAYTLLMTLTEYVEAEGLQREVLLFASDVSDADIAIARAGVYPASIAEEMSKERLDRFFVRSNGGYRIKEGLRDKCVFARHDVTRDPPFSRLDLVSCRNLMIYFSVALQRRALTFFHYALRPGGFLLLGGSEGVNAARGMFTPTHKRLPLFVRADVPSRLPATRRSYPLGADLALADRGATLEHDLRRDVETLLVDRYAPASVLVGPDMRILQFSGRTGRYLEPSTGEADLDLLRMMREGLVPDLESALAEARSTRAPARRGGVHVLGSEDTTPVVIEAIPLTTPGLEGLILITFTAEPSVPASPDEPLAAPTDHDAADLAQLRTALASSNAAVRMLRREHSLATERLRTAVEAGQSANEELQSMNEELETAKEELQATNEELATVNDELRSRNADQIEVNADLNNLLENMSVPTIMLDRELRVRRYTENAVPLLNLIPGDVGRPMTDIRGNIDIPDAAGTLRRALASAKPTHVEALADDGRWYSVLTRGFRGSDNRVDGVVVSFVDINELKQAQGSLERAAVLGLTLSAAANSLTGVDGIADEMASALEASAKAIGAKWCAILLEHEEGWRTAFTSGRAGPRKGSIYDARAVLEVAPGLTGKGVVATTHTAQGLAIVSAPLAFAESVSGAVSFGFDRRTVGEAEYSFVDRLAITLTLAIESSRRREELAQIVKLRTHELESALDNLERAAQVKDRFLADMSHELRTPLNSVLGFSTVLLQGMAGPLTEEQIKQVEMIHKSGANLLELVAGLLDLAAIDAGVVETVCAEFSVETMLTEIRDQLGPVAKSKGIALRVARGAGMSMCSDEGKVRQILLNVAGNALKFTDKGSVTLGVRALGDDRLAFTVKDTGPGIKKADLPRVLDPFVQFPRAGQVKPPGAGLGLAISARLATALGGTLEVDSTAGKGTTCVLDVPRCPEQEPSCGAPPRPAERPGRLSKGRG